MLVSCRAVENGHIKRITDGDVQSSVLEIASANVATTFIKCPADPDKTLGIKLPFLVMIIKNLNKYFSFEVQVLDDKNVRRRFRASNYQVSLRVSHLAQQQHGPAVIQVWDGSWHQWRDIGISRGTMQIETKPGCPLQSLVQACSGRWIRPWAEQVKGPPPEEESTSPGLTWACAGSAACQAVESYRLHPIECISVTRVRACMRACVCA